jgi:DNA-binding NtrC family response regulator
MSANDVLKGKKILLVDDETDVLDVLEALLDMCETFRATSFEKAKALLEAQAFDLTVLDIMGVNGFGLLEIARKKNIPALMLTAHAFTPDTLVRSIKEGAVSYVPKEEITRIPDFIRDIFKDHQEGRDTWEQWQNNFPPTYFEKRWKAAWKAAGKDFQEALKVHVRARAGKKP